VGGWVGLKGFLAVSLTLAAKSPRPNNAQISYFYMGVRKNQKQSLKRHELTGRTESRTFREMRQRTGRYFIAVKNDDQGQE
jgi:hypothetical protein